MQDPYDSQENLYPETACCVLVTDCSGSVRSILPELNAAKRDLIRALQSCAVGVELAEVTFADDAHVVQDFENVHRVTPQDYGASGSTNGSAGISLGQDLAEGRKAYFKTTGTPYKQPIMVVASDGAFNRETRPGYRERVVRAVNEGELVVVPLAFGSLAAYPHLEAISPDCKPVIVNAGTAADINFKELVRLLSESVNAGSIEALQDVANEQAEELGEQL